MARFHTGDQISILPISVDTHHRTPNYIKGKVGRVQALCGIFPDPESRAYGGSGRPEQALYRVEFDMSDLWGETIQRAGQATACLSTSLSSGWRRPNEQTCHGE